ncbi:MAG: hypothetical protein R3250_16890 [Melioribacteraceae bacterium]|nr:hypothetical protein [Melioribacteraceae bacterium]
MNELLMTILVFMVTYHLGVVFEDKLRAFVKFNKDCFPKTSWKELKEGLF